MNKEYCVGVIGYSAQRFDKVVAGLFLNRVCDFVKLSHPDKNISVVSGLTDLGMPAIAYREAKSLGWKTVGVACTKAEEYETFNVEKRKIVGDNWGDESRTFLDSIDMLVCVGGGNQSKRELEEWKKTGKPFIEYNLPASLEERA
ncbi:MAG TPA: hypothetical protein VHA12_03155 [Candidatus Nanoarchaeia archaeon]|nr:hypothetical protein [Candidatus Nanoarchaeia archaeon]